MNPECPNELLALDSNAATLWPKLRKKAKVTIDRELNEIVPDQRGSILKGIGLPDLLFRLECQRQREKGGRQDELARARIWFHVSEACAPGDFIPDLTSDSRYLLNPWIVSSSLKYPNLKLERLSKVPPGAVPLCANDRCSKGEDGRRAVATAGKYCSNSCRSSMGRRLPAKSTRRRHNAAIAA